MINPNKEYKTKTDATIIKIDPLDGYIPYVQVRTPDGRIYEGSILDIYSRPSSLRIGDLVGFTLKFSIVGDRVMLARLVKRRAVK